MVFDLTEYVLDEITTNFDLGMSMYLTPFDWNFMWRFVKVNAIRIIKNQLKMVHTPIRTDMASQRSRSRRSRLPLHGLRLTVDRAQPPWRTLPVNKAWW